MQLRPQDLGAHLARKLAPLYVVHGDEPLAAIETADAIRAAARRAGCDEREMFIVEQHFRWDGFIAANANLGLFGSRKLIDLRIPSGKPGVEGAAALERHVRHLDADNVTLVSLPRVDRATQSSAWFTALAEHGVTIAVAPIDRAALPAWLAERLSRNDQRATRDTLAFLGRALRRQPARRTAGNRQARAAAAARRARATPTSSARWRMSPATTSRNCRKRGSTAMRRERCASSTDCAAKASRSRSSIWQLAEDLHALAGVRDAVGRGQSLAQRDARRSRLGQAPGRARARGAPARQRRHRAAARLAREARRACEGPRTRRSVGRDRCHRARAVRKVGRVER